MSAKQLLFYITSVLLLDHETRAQSSQIGDFVGQLTSLLNQGGGLASLAGALQGLQGQGGSPGVYAPQQGGYFGQTSPGAGGVLGGPGYGFPPRPPPPGSLPPGGGFPPPPGGFPGGFPGGSPFGGVPPPGGAPPQYPGALGGYAPTSLYGALASIAQYDDLRCVPRLLCEVAAGAKPGSNNYNNYGSSSTQAGPFPFLTKDAVITLLTVLNFVDDSPLLVFGRAAVLGYTARGDPRACLIAYPTCPRDPDKLVDYLNNHNGGFFRFFSNQQIPQYAPHYQYYVNPQSPHPQRPYYPHPQQGPGPQAPHYPSPPPQPLPPPNYYRPQRPYRPQPPPQNYNQRPYNPQQYYQGRIQNGPQGSSGYDGQDSSGGTTKLVFSNGGPLDSDYYNTNNYYGQSNQSYNQQPTNDYNKYDDYYNKQTLNKQPDRKKVIFPVTSSYGSSGYDQSSASSSSQHSYHDVSGEKYTRNGKTLTFPSVGNNGNDVTKSGTQMIFPDRTGTGDLRLDVDEFGDYKTVHFASEGYGIYRDQRDVFKNVLKFPVEEHNANPYSGSGDNTMTFPRAR